VVTNASLSNAREFSLPIDFGLNSPRCLYFDESRSRLCVGEEYAGRVEYASCVWSPYQMGQIKQIESVQRSFTRRLLYRASIDYNHRIGVDSLEIRRLRQVLIHTYKIVFGLVTNAGNEFFTLANSVNANINTRGHLYQLYPHHSRIDACKYFFTERVVRGWNGLPAEQRHFCS